MFKFLKGKNLVIACLVLLIGIAVGGQSLYAIGTNLIENYDSFIKFNQGYYSELPIQTTSTITGVGFVNTGDQTVGGTFGVTGATTLDGLTTFNAGTVHSSPLSTSTTATTYTWVLADIDGYESIIMTPNVGTLTITPFASSTAESYLPTAGDKTELCVFNATTTTDVLITFVSGASFDIGTSTYNAGLSINSGEWGCLDIMREPATVTTYDFGAILRVGQE